MDGWKQGLGADGRTGRGRQGRTDELSGSFYLTSQKFLFHSLSNCYNKNYYF